MRLAAFLFASGLMGTTLLASALSAHMISLLSNLGLATTAAVWVSALRGVGQSGARLCEIIFGRHLDPLMLGVVAAGITVIGVASGLWSGTSLGAALAFSLLFGAGNGLATIVRGTQPLILFDPASYGFLTGWLITPSFFISAAAPVTVAFLADAYGPIITITLALLFALGTLVSAIALWIRFR